MTRFAWVAGFGVLLALFLLVYAPGQAVSASTAGEIQVYYLYSHECLSCEQSWPLIKEDLDKSPAEISLHMLDINTREGAAFARARGISSVPAIAFDDGSAILFEQCGDPRSFEAAFKARLAQRAEAGLPLTVTRTVTRNDAGAGTVTVKTYVACMGDRPVAVTVNRTTPEGCTLISGQESWNGTLRPGESKYLACTCQVPAGTGALPPLTVAYDDGTGPRSIIGPETPIIVLQELSALAVYLAGLIAGINPCLLAVMAFIGTTTIADTGHRTAVLCRIVAFSGGMLAVYLLIGIGLMQLIDRFPLMSVLLRASIILLLLALAGWSFFDAWRTGKGHESATLKSIIGRIRPFYLQYGLIASFAIGSIFGLVKMPCVGGIYIAILGTILDNGEAARGLVLLLVYNLGVVTPVLLLGTLITVGLSPATVNQFRLRHRVELKAFTGVLLALMAVAFMLGIM